MNEKLYRILVLHAGPKSQHTATETFLISKSEEDVAKWIDDNHNCRIWSDRESDGDTRWDEEKEEDILFKDWLMQNKGDLEDEDGWGDAYYGITKWGWEEIKGATEEDFETLLKLKIAEKI